MFFLRQLEHMFTDLLRGGGIVFSLLGAGLSLGLFFTPDNGKNRLVIIIEVNISFKNSHVEA